MQAALCGAAHNNKQVAEKTVISWFAKTVAW
jgi:hypothetical protein